MNKFKLDHRGEFDETFASNASVHIERQADKAFWIGIDIPGEPSLMINTGVSRGEWYFNVEEDDLHGRSFGISRSVSRAKGENG